MLNTLKTRKKDEGFTIIEVLIVLAIAGLILLIVFLAVPALQRNARNTQRKADASKLAALVNDYTSNHAGNLPVAISNTAGLDVASEKWSIISVPSTSNLVTTSAFGTTSAVNINKGFSCDPSTNTLTSGNTRQFAVSFLIETSGGTQPVCLNG